MVTREVARQNLVRSMRLRHEELMPEAERPSPVQYALQGTWTHPNPSMIGWHHVNGVFIWEVYFSDAYNRETKQIVFVMQIGGVILLLAWCLLRLLYG